MSALWSASTGMLVVPDQGGGTPTIRSVDEGAGLSEEDTGATVALVNDWERVDDEINEGLLRTLQEEYWLGRAASYVRFLLRGVSVELENDVLLEVEGALQTRVSPRALLSELAVAPLLAPERLGRLVESAFSEGLAAVAGVIESLRELQPQIRRMTDAWLRLPETAFASLSCSRQQLWRRVAASGALVDMLEAETAAQFSAAYLPVLRSLGTQDGRHAAAVFGKLSRELHPSGRQAARLPAPECDRDEAPEVEDRRPRRRRHSTVHEAFQNVKRQIDAVVNAVSRGQDGIAARFLGDLVADQQDTPRHAVMSLCNIAQRCKDMFRADFERTCLEMAMGIGEQDAWLLTQYGDHLKRSGKYDEALATLEHAAAIGAGERKVVARSVLASVWAQRSDYAEAEKVYRSIPGWESNLPVRTALAHLERHKGEYDEAEKQYRLILVRWPGEARALGGIAETAKRKGDLGRAVAIYEDLIERQDHRPRDLQIWRLALCHILKLQGEFDRALAVVDEVVQESPFLMDARAQRGAILGLMGRELDALVDIPPRSRRAAIGEWLQQYVLGLLLQKLDRFADSRGQLVERFNETVPSDDTEARLRLGAALWFLSEGQPTEAEQQIARITVYQGYYESYIGAVLRLHLAVVKSDQEQIASLRRELEDARREEPLVDDAVRALERGDFAEAQKLEVALLLRAA